MSKAIVRPEDLYFAQLRWVGRQHLQNGTTACQDSVYSILSDDYWIFAGSDGAGSGKYSETGANIMSSMACHVVKNNIRKGAGARELTFIYQRTFLRRLKLVRESLGYSEALNDHLKATLFLFVVDFKAQLITYLNVGDGYIFTPDGQAIKLGHGGKPCSPSYCFAKSDEKEFSDLREKSYTPQCGQFSLATLGRLCMTSDFPDHQADMEKVLEVINSPLPKVGKTATTRLQTELITGKYQSFDDLSIGFVGRKGFNNEQSES